MQLDLFIGQATPIATPQPSPVSAWRDAVCAARKQSPANYPLGLVLRPFGGIWDRVTSPEASLPARNDDWPHLWFIYCPIGRHAASSATLTSGYQDRRSA